MVKISFYTGSQSEVLFANGFAYPIANASSTSAQFIMAAASGKNQQPLFPGGFFQQSRTGQVVSVDFAVALATTTSTTTSFTAGLSTTSGNATGTTLVSSQPFTSNSWTGGVAYGRIIISCFGAGYGTGATGTETNLWSTMGVIANSGAASGGVAAAGGPTNATLSGAGAIDFSVNQWLYLTVTFGTTASTSNTATLQQIIVCGLN